MITGNMDGLQVLKGGQGKATVYFTKEVMHGALDLNEASVIIGKITECQTAEKTALDVVMQYIGPQLRAIDEIMAPYGLTAILLNIDAKKAMEEETEKGETENPLFEEKEKTEGGEEDAE